MNELMNNDERLKEANDLIKTMGAIIRQLDQNNAHCEYWLNDGNENGPDYVPAAKGLQPKDEMPNYHLFTVKRLFQTNTKPHRTLITSERYGTSVEITEQNAIDYLIEKGYNIVAEAEGHTHKNGVKPMYLMSDTFKPFKK
jgi:hypothetical protein